MLKFVAAKVKDRRVTIVKIGSSVKSRERAVCRNIHTRKSTRKMFYVNRRKRGNIVFSPVDKIVSVKKKTQRPHWQ